VAQLSTLGGITHHKKHTSMKKQITSYVMKNIIIIGVMAVLTLLTSCERKNVINQNNSVVADTKHNVAASRVVGYAIADTSKSTNIIFTITEIWKGENEGSAFGITNGTQIRYQSPDTEYRPDAAIVIFPKLDGNLESRSLTFVYQGKMCGMSVQEFKTKIGL
jgi:hypothetical protein